MRRLGLAMVAAGLAMILAMAVAARAADVAASAATPSAGSSAATPTATGLNLYAGDGFEPVLLPLPADTEKMREASKHYVRGKLYLSVQRFADAVGELRQAAALAPNVPKILINLGLAYHDAGNVPSAADVLDKALKLTPDDTAALYFRARIARTLKDNKIAAQSLKHLLDVESKNTPYRILGTFHLGQIEQETRDADIAAGRAESAAANLDAAIGHFESLLEMLGDPQPFFQRYPDIAGLYTNQPQLKEVLVRLYMQKGSGAKAAPLIAELLEIQPKHPGLLAALSQAYLAQKDYAGAKAAAKRIIDAYPDDVAGYQRLGEAYRLSGDAKGIVPELEKYHADKPKNMTVSFQLADYYALFGRRDDASAIYRQILSTGDKKQQMTLAAAVKLADLEVQAKQPVEALAVLADVMTPGVSEATILVRAAQIIEALPDAPAAYKGARRLVADENRNYAPFVLVGMLAEQAKQADEAIALYDKALEREPNASIAYSRKADLLIAARKHADALKVYQTAIEAGNDTPVFHRKMGMLLEYLEKPDEALVEYQAVRRTDPNDKINRYLLAGLLARTGKTDDAEKELRNLLVRFPREIQAYCQLASLYVTKGDLESAERAVTDAQNVDPSAVAPKSILAEIRLRQKRFDDAEKVARDVLEDHPEAGDIRRLLVYVLTGQKKYKDAARELKALLAADPENLDDRHLLATVYSEMGDPQASEKELQQILTKKPGDPASANDLGYMWAERGVNLAKAEELIRMALKSKPESPPYLDSLGWVLYKQGKFADAAKALEDAAKAVPDGDPVMWDHLGDVYWRLSRPQDAAKAWQAALKILKSPGVEPRAGDLERVEKKVQNIEAGKEPTVAPLPPKE
jgi:tetratricopeptide (TPR) repeat protein